MKNEIKQNWKSHEKWKVFEKEGDPKGEPKNIYEWKKKKNDTEIHSTKPSPNVFFFVFSILSQSLLFIFLK